jgi:hypothetical protein
MNELLDMQHTRGEQAEQIQEQWADGAAQKRWSEALQIVIKRWREIEWRSIATGLRECGLMAVADAELPTFAEILATAGLDLVPLQRIAATGTYANRLTQPGENGVFFCLVSRAGHASRFVRLWKAHSHAAMGRLLGYPDCCIAFFERVWPEFSDTTWPMTRNTLGHCYDPASLTCVVDGPWQTNVLLRWLGVRAVPHFPCSFSCEKTVKFANALAALCPGEGAGLCEEILRWPVQWSALNGRVEIRTQQITIVTTTDITPQRYTVQRIESEKQPVIQSSKTTAQITSYARAASDSRIVHPVLQGE